MGKRKMRSVYIVGMVLLMMSCVVGAQEIDENSSMLSRPVDFTREKLERILQLREKAHHWEHIVRGFRKEHHFTLLAGFSNGEWKFQKYGTAINSEHNSSAVEMRFRYNFHIPIHGGFGYFLGSGFGMQNERNVDRRINEPTVLQFPGISAGFVFNLSPVIRIKTGSEFYLERWDGLGLETEEWKKDKSVSVTTRVSSLFVSLDVFFDLYYAVSVEYSSRKNFYLRPTKSGDQQVDAELEKQVDVISLAFTYHLM